MKRLLVIGLLLWVSITACTSACAAVTQDDLGALKELQQTKLDAVKELHQKDVDALRQQVAAVDKRVDDQLAQVGQAVDRFSAQSAWTGILITVLMVFGGFLGYRNAKQEAKAEAKDAAANQSSETAKQWFERHASDLKARIGELESKATQVHKQMDETAQDLVVHAEDIKKQQTQALATVQDMVSKTQTPPSPEQQKAQEVLKNKAEELKNTGESSRSFDDWNTLAHTAYGANNLEDAAYYWRKAAEVPHASEVNIATALFKRGVTQGQLNQSQAELATYDELLSRFADAPEQALREQVAKALLNKGLTQIQLDQPEAAMATHDELLRRFADAPEPVLREQVARAFNNKGLTQKKLNQPRAAIATHNELLRRFADAPEPVLREQVALALLTRGLAQHQLNQLEAEIASYGELLHRFADATEPALQEWVVKTRHGRGLTRLLLAKRLGLSSLQARRHLHAALTDFNQAVERENPPSGMVLGYRAYAHQLLGNSAQAEQDFASALRATSSGGEALYKGTLADLAMHPIPEDAAMRALVERSWVVYQQEQGEPPTESDSPEPNPH